ILFATSLESSIKKLSIGKNFVFIFGASWRWISARWRRMNFCPSSAWLKGRTLINTLAVFTSGAQSTFVMVMKYSKGTSIFWETISAIICCMAAFNCGRRLDILLYDFLVYLIITVMSSIVRFLKSVG